MAPLPEPGQDPCLVVLDDDALMAAWLGSEDRSVYRYRGGEQGGTDLSVSFGTDIEATDD